MNIWTKKSADFANNSDYLDQLFKIYEIADNERRIIAPALLNKITTEYENRDTGALLEDLFTLDLFPIKDSYVASLKRDKTAISRNPETVTRIADRIYALGLDELLKKITEPKETNRQMGPLFKDWINKCTLGYPVFDNIEDFDSYNGDAILNVSDEAMKKYASEYLGYQREKGLDFFGKFNGKYVIGEAKFLTDFGGHQNAQFDDAVKTITSTFRSNVTNAEIITIGILDGVCYIKGNNKLYRYLENHDEQIILSALKLKEFLLSL